MNGPSPENRLWLAHLELLGSLAAAAKRKSSLTTEQAELARRGEWTAALPGRLGRRLLPEVERYLEFFAIAR